MRRRSPVLLVLLLLGGCAVGPRYQKPTVPLPESYRGLTREEASGTSIGEQEYSAVFQDEVLVRLLRTALEQNYDVRIAAARILQAEAQLGITRADEFPTVDGGAQISSVRFARSRFTTFSITEGQLALFAAWEPDFWKKFRSASDAARASLLSSHWAREAVKTTLVSELASAYFQLRERDLELEISRRTLASRQDSLRIIQLQAERGLTSMLDVRQAEQLVYVAAQAIPELEQRIEQQENLIRTLLGNFPDAVPRGTELTQQPLPPEVPAGLPSSLLERRPDLRQAEQQLIVLNAQIGVVKAAVYPRITLTATGGFQSPSLTNLFSGPAGLWNFVGALTQPIFSKGKLRAGIKFVEAQQQEALLAYEQAVQQAFREVSDALVVYRKSREFREQQEQLRTAAQDAARLSDIRYGSGLTSYLEVLSSQTNLFAAERGLAQAQLNERLALVQLYKALGGGWEATNP
jgi:multidrug efflux system outer membrane protein